MLKHMNYVFLIAVILYSPVDSSSQQKKAVIIGGGPAGLTAAMELADAGFKVNLYEQRKRFGGKMVGFIKHKNLPTEHAFRLYSFKYIAFGDVMDRAGLEPPTKANPNTSPNFKQTKIVFGSRQSGLAEASPSVLVAKLMEFGISPFEIQYFAFQIKAFNMLSLTEINSYNTVTFLDFIDGFAFDQWEKVSGCLNVTLRSTLYCQPQHSPGFHFYVTRHLGIIAAKKPSLPPPMAIYTFENTFAPDLSISPACMPAYHYFNNRYLTAGPTSLQVVDPWVKHIRSLGANLHTKTSVRHLDIDEGSEEVKSVKIRSKKKKEVEDADVFVMALPVDDAEYLLPGVTKGRAGSTLWAVGVQFYLQCLSDEYRDFYANKTLGTLMIDSPYHIAYMIQSPYDGPWKGANFRLNRKYDYILSVVVSNTTSPGLNGKTFQESTKDEAFVEILDQITFPDQVQCTRRNGRDVTYTKQDVADAARNGEYLLDVPDEVYQKKKNNKFKTSLAGPVKSDGKRWVLTVPAFEASDKISHISPITKYKNLFLAGEFVATPLLNLNTMEHAVESGKLAAQAAIDQVGLSHKVRQVDLLLSMVNSTTVAEYDQMISQGIFNGIC